MSSRHAPYTRGVGEPRHREGLDYRRHDMAHEDGDQTGLHDDDILILGFLWIAITDQLFSRKVFFVFLFLIQINYLYNILDF